MNVGVMNRVRLPGDMFRFTFGDRSEVYSAVLHVFGEANERLETSLSLDDVARRLDALGWAGVLPLESLIEALKQLRSWHLLDVSQNHAGNYRTAEEYERRNLQYSLTRNGEAALAGLEQAAAVLASTGALQTAVLDAIAERLGELARLLGDPGSSERRIFSALQELEGHLDALRTNTKQFVSQLQRLLRVEGTGQDTFREVKAATVAYLEEFLANLDIRVHLIATAAAAIERHGVQDLHERALRGAELPALSTDDDLGPDWLEHRRSRWAGLQAWFTPQDGSEPRAEQLHVIARRAIVTLLQALDRINESRRRSSSAASDLRELARWFALAPSESDAHRLWSSAFGLGSARHAHLVHPDPELIPTGTSWHQAPPVPVSALIRSSARTERFSRTGRVRDVTDVRAARGEHARTERAALVHAWQQLDTGGPVRLSEMGRLDHPTLDRLLDLIGRALASPPDATGARRQQSTDGRAEVILRSPLDARRAVIRTPHGTFSGPDYLLQIDVAGVVRTGEATG